MSFCDSFFLNTGICGNRVNVYISIASFCSGFSVNPCIVFTCGQKCCGLHVALTVQVICIKITLFNVIRQVILHFSIVVADEKHGQIFSI